MRKRGLLVRFRSERVGHLAITATMRQAAKLQRDPADAAHGRLARKTFKAHTGSGTVRLRIPRARLAGHANGRHPRAGPRAGRRQVRAALACSCASAL